MIANAERIAELRAAIDAERAEVGRRMVRIAELAAELRAAEQEAEAEAAPAPPTIAALRANLQTAAWSAGNAWEMQIKYPEHADHWIAVRANAQARADELRAQIAELEAGR